MRLLCNTQTSNWNPLTNILPHEAEEQEDEDDVVKKISLLSSQKIPKFPHIMKKNVNKITGTEKVSCQNLHDANAKILLFLSNK